MSHTNPQQIHARRNLDDAKQEDVNLRVKDRVDQLKRKEVDILQRIKQYPCNCEGDQTYKNQNGQICLHIVPEQLQNCKKVLSRTKTIVKQAQLHYSTTCQIDNCLLCDTDESKWRKQKI